MRKTIKITYHGNSVTVALVERPLLANESEYSNSVLSPKARKKVIGEDKVHQSHIFPANQKKRIEAYIEKLRPETIFTMQPHRKAHPLKLGD